MVEAARARSEPDRATSRAESHLRELRARIASGADDDLVQLAVRLPTSLRRAARAAAELDGISLQDLVRDALIDALDRRVSATRQLAEHMTADLLVRVREALDLDGYAEYVASIDDPDLRNA